MPNVLKKLWGNWTALYLSNGYAAARFYLPEQDLKTGTLKLRVEEGKIKPTATDRTRQRHNVIKNRHYWR